MTLSVAAPGDTNPSDAMVAKLTPCQSAIVTLLYLILIWYDRLYSNVLGLHLL